jgi:hypothetical protein
MLFWFAQINQSGRERILNFFILPGISHSNSYLKKILTKEVEELISQITKNKCTHLKLNEGLTIPSKSEATKNSGGRNFMKDAKTTILNDPAILRATQILNGTVESVTIEGIKNK